MLKQGKIFGKINVIDCIIVLVVIVMIFSALAVKKGLYRPNVNSQGIKTVEFEVTTRAYDITSQKDILTKGDKTFITIRNVPYTELEIVDVKKDSMREMFFNYDRPEVPYLIKNVAYPNRYQYVVTLKDNAQITDDGAVIGGNKIKIGLPIDLEGFNYRISGTVSDVRVIEETKE